MCHYIKTVSRKPTASDFPHMPPSLSSRLACVCLCVYGLSLCVSVCVASACVCLYVWPQPVCVSVCLCLCLWPQPVCVSVQHKEPRGPRPICDLLIEKLATAEAEVVQLVRETGQTTPQNARGHRSSASVRYCPLAGQCNVWDAHAGSVVFPMTATAVPFYYSQ